MNTYQTNLYNDLIKLTNENEAFFFSEVDFDDTHYRIFNYRMASYTDFLLPSALECRGVMFEVDNDGNALSLKSLPLAKFFNLHENPMTMDLDLSTIVEIADKADGSLISTWNHIADEAKDEFQVKSKGSLYSDQAVAANMWLHLPENKTFRDELILAERLECTVCLEWCAPNNRIVLPYMEPHLKVLGVRSRETGEYVEFDDIDSYHFPESLIRWTKIIHTHDPEAYINSVDDMQGVEGVVFRLPSGQRVKKKCSWYLALHHTKDSINIPRRLYESVLEEATDDMRSLFHDDPLAIKLISEMEVFVEHKYNHLVDKVEKFYDRHKNADRKTYAITGQASLTQIQFGLAMAKYLGRDFSYKETMKKRWKEFGLVDEKVVDLDV